MVRAVVSKTIDRSSILLGRAMKQYKVTENTKIFATDDLSRYLLYLKEDALILVCDTCPWPFGQTTIRERIDATDLMSLIHKLEEVEVQSLRDVAKHNSINKLTVRREL
jgi:hypothetical protein